MALQTNAVNIIEITCKKRGSFSKIENTRKRVLTIRKRNVKSLGHIMSSLVGWKILFSAISDATYVKIRWKLAV